MNLCDLKKPFPENDIEWRVQRGGETNGKPWALVLAYITNRAIMERLDEVCGPENWKNDYKEAPSGGNLCGISIFISTHGEWVTKWDGADNTNIEATKGGLSDAMKRAGYQWGIGRYLYKLEGNFANISNAGKYNSKININGTDKWIKWDAPSLPNWALPKGTKPLKKSQDAPQSSKTPLHCSSSQKKMIHSMMQNLELNDKEMVKFAKWLKYFPKVKTYNMVVNGEELLEFTEAGAKYVIDNMDDLFEQHMKVEDNIPE